MCNGTEGVSVRNEVKYSVFGQPKYLPKVLRRNIV